MTNPPSPVANPLGSDHATNPACIPLAPATGLSDASYTCQCTLPPRFQAVPSSHASSTSPFLLIASEGCFRLFPLPGAAIGAPTLFSLPRSIAANEICPPVSQA